MKFFYSIISILLLTGFYTDKNGIFQKNILPQAPSLLLKSMFSEKQYIIADDFLHCQKWYFVKIIYIFNILFINKNEIF
jgi:hypothetical protein